MLHSRPQSRVPFGQRHGTKALAGTNLKSANRGLPVVLLRLGADPKWLTKFCDFWSFSLGNSWFDQPSTEGKAIRSSQMCCS